MQFIAVWTQFVVLLSQIVVVVVMQFIVVVMQFVIVCCNRLTNNIAYGLKVSTGIAE